MLDLARQDLQALCHMSDPSDFGESIFGFHAQQATEKTVKAWLSTVGLSYPRTHDLAALFALLEKSGTRVPKRFRLLMDLNDFAVAFRYSFDSALEDALDRQEVARQVTDFVEYVASTLSETEENHGTL